MILLESFLLAPEILLDDVEKFHNTPEHLYEHVKFYKRLIQQLFDYFWAIKFFAYRRLSHSCYGALVLELS